MKKVMRCYFVKNAELFPIQTFKHLFSYVLHFYYIGMNITIIFTWTCLRKLELEEKCLYFISETYLRYPNYFKFFKII